jgi:hypothetical protein
MEVRLQLNHTGQELAEKSEVLNRRKWGTVL